MIDRDVPRGDPAIEAMCKAFAEATGYYVEFHLGLRSASSDKYRIGMKAALDALTALASQGGAQAGEVVEQYRHRSLPWGSGEGWGGMGRWSCWREGSPPHRSPRFEYETRTLYTSPPAPDEAVRVAVEAERKRCDKLTDAMMRAACKAHFRSENIDGVNITFHGIDYSFRQAFRRMWNGAIRARKGGAS